MLAGAGSLLRRMELTYDLDDRVTDADTSAIDAGLVSFNLKRGGIDEVRRLAVVARDSEGRPVAGSIGRTWGECYEIQVLWVRKDLRRAGVGSRLLEMSEAEAARRGCTLVHLDTYDFQAPEFYRRHGYEEFHRIAGFPRGIERFYLSKRLSS